MSHPLPVARSTTPIPVSAMDCIARGDPAQGQFDNQRYSGISKNLSFVRDDAKLLWQQELIPYRNIHFAARNLNQEFPGLLGEVESGQLWKGKTVNIGDPNNPVPTQWGQEYTLGFPFFGFDQRFLYPIAELNIGGNGFWAWSHWMWSLIGTTVAPITPIDPNLMFKVGLSTQLICPNAFRPTNYELWTVTTRNNTASGEGDPLDVPNPFPWSDSSDWAQDGGGVLQPGQTLIIPIPIEKSPQRPPGQDVPGAPTYGAVEGWGVARFIYFPPPSA